MSLTASKAFDEAAAEKKFLNAKNTQESVQSVSSWAMQHKSHHEKIVQVWFSVLKKCECCQMTDYLTTLRYNKHELWTFRSQDHLLPGGVSLKTDRTTAQQTAQLEGDDNVHARLLDRIDDRTANFCKQFDHCLYAIHYVDPFLNQIKIKNELTF